MSPAQHKNLPDKKLADLCVRGDAAAWSAFVDRYGGVIQQTIYATLRRFSANDQSPDRVKDLFQMAFVALCEDDCRRLGSYSGKNGASLATWLRVVVSRLVIDHIRKKILPSVPLDSAPPADESRRPAVNPADPGPLPLELLESQEAVNFLRKEMESLPPREKLIFKLRFEDGLPGEEAAGILNITRNNLDQIVHRVKLRLREKARRAGFF